MVLVLVWLGNLSWDQARMESLGFELRGVLGAAHNCTLISFKSVH